MRPLNFKQQDMTLKRERIAEWLECELGKRASRVRFPPEPLSEEDISERLDLSLDCGEFYRLLVIPDLCCLLYTSDAADE